jgi:hypothetical protein
METIAKSAQILVGSTPGRVPDGGIASRIGLPDFESSSECWL